MNRIGFVICAMLFVAAAAIFCDNINQAAATCSSEDWAAWRTSPTGDTATAAGHFDTASSPGATISLQLNWSFRETPFMGAGEVNATGNVNINTNSVVYDPAYFFPAVCIGSVGIHVSGDLSNASSDGTLKSLGWVWDSGTPPPYAEGVHTLAITHG